MAVDQPTCRVGLLLRKPPPRCERVRIHRFFRRQIAVTLAESAVVNGEYSEPESVQLLDAAELARQIPSRAMKIEHRRRVGMLGRPPPCIELRRVRGGTDRQRYLAHAIRKAAEPSRLDARWTKRQLALALFE